MQASIETPKSSEGQPRASLLEAALAALGFTTISLLWLIQPGVEPLRPVFYHWSGNPKTVFFTIALAMLGAWCFIKLLMLIGRIPGRTRVAIWSALLFFLPWIVYVNYRLVHYERPYPRYSCPLFLSALIATLLLTALWRPSFAPRFDRVVASASTVLTFAGVFGLFLFCRLAWCGWKVSSINQDAALHHRQIAAMTQPHRIIWIVFDELSYRQVYGHRFAGLQLPAFDALAKQSTVFTNVVPVGISTEIVLPGLIAGKPFDQTNTLSSGQLSVHNASSDAWQAFNPHDSSFQDALNAGYSTAVAGWYNPYCRIMPQVLDQCSWSFRYHLLNGMVSSEPITSNLLNSLDMLACALSSAEPRRWEPDLPKCRLLFMGDSQLTESHVRNYEDLYATSQKLLRDRSASFVLLHLPIPHPGGIYNRATGQMSTSATTYIDNLALTDRCLAGLRATLEQMGQWDSSTIVVMGDHGWRTKQLWEPTNLWSAEEQIASNGGKYDPRPAYIVKLPGQTTAARINASYHAVNTRELFDQLLAHTITTPAELSTWAQSVH